MVSLNSTTSTSFVQLGVLIMEEEATWSTSEPLLLRRDMPWLAVLITLKTVVGFNYLTPSKPGGHSVPH